MPFLTGCSCHVWAIDGWTNDATSHIVNTHYATVGTDLMINAPNSALSDKVMALIAGCRVSNGASRECIIYGGFQNAADGSPEHMWIEYQGHIYDTMPGAPLRRVLATPQSRNHPPSEVGAFAPAMVGICPGVLTVGHLNTINGAVWANVVMPNAMNGQDCTPP